MALIIKGDMPKGCGWDCDLWSEGLCAPLQKSVDEHIIDSDCPIIGEIPDRHGRMIDADALEERAYLVKGVDGRIRTVIELCDIEDAPTVLEATE